MKRLLITSTAVALLAVASQAAIAADMPVRQPLPPQGPVTAPPPPMFNWSGFYVGAHGGYGWGRSEFNSPTFGSTGTFNANGWTFGGVAGVNYQAGATVFGVEADINWANFGGSTTCPGGGVCETDMPWYGTVRGRLGYAVDRFMPFLTGGLAYGKVEANEVGVGSTSSTRVGWTVGAGAEYALTENVSWKTEYLYMDLGSFTCSACLDDDRVKFRSHVVRTGLNFRF